MDRNDVTRMAREAGLLFNEDYGTVKAQQIHASRIDAFTHLIASHVAEECAKVCDVTPPEPFRPSIEAAHAIRSLYKPTA